MRVLISGSKGFLGQACQRSLSNHSWLELESDITSPAQLEKELRPLQFDAVVHLAAISDLATCQKSPENAVKVNALGAMNLAVEAFRAQPQAPFIFISTGQIYAKSERPLSESSPDAPDNAYSRSKKMAEDMLADFSRNFGQNSVILRLFNHTHKSQDDRFFLPSMYKQIQAAKESGQSMIKTGNLQLIRDISSVFDFTAAIDAILKSLSSLNGLHRLNVCSGKGKNLQQLVELLAKKLEADIHFEVDPSRLRAGEPTHIVGDSTQLQKMTGWSPLASDAEKLIELFFKDL